MKEGILINHNDTALIRPMAQSDIKKIVINFEEQGWSRPQETFETYLTGQENGDFFVFVAEYCSDVAGYVVLYPNAKHGPFAHRGIPDLSDFLVFIKYQRKGIGSQLLDAAEAKAGERSDAVSLGVGVHSGYGSAQRLYSKRGYIPDGTGVWYQTALLAQYAACKNDDDLILYLSKSL